MDKQLYILRGLPSAGKTEVADIMVQGNDDCVAHAIEDFFYDEEREETVFDPNKLPEAYADCLKRVEDSLQDDAISTVIVHNIFATQYECKPYFDLAEKHGASVRVISMFDGGMNDTQLEKISLNGWRKRAISSKRRSWELNVYPHRSNKPKHKPSREDTRNPQMVVIPYEALANLTSNHKRRKR